MTDNGHPIPFILGNNMIYNVNDSFSKAVNIDPGLETPLALAPATFYSP